MPIDPQPDKRLPPLRDVIRRHELGARRSLGQHFLLDLNLTRRIVREAGSLAGKTILEIGPGPGGLTRALLESDAKRVLALERDPRCVAALHELVQIYPERLEIIEADALRTTPATLAATQGDASFTCTIIANLPYNISVKLLIGWLHELSHIDDMVLMFQKEVADRLAAKPGSSSYGRTSVITQWLCTVDALFDIPGSAFVPPPKVTSTVARFKPRHKPLAEADFKTLEAVTRAAFGQRRKMLRSALKTLPGDAAGMLEEAGIRPEARAETLSVEEFCALARAFAGQQKDLLR
jgi:16S rRNA (adenine1518-N6/adenine1519-N6)-dimethyltransferase